MVVRKWYTEQNIQDVADAIREKDGIEDKMLVTDMPGRIRDLPSKEKVEFLEGRLDRITARMDGIEEGMEQHLIKAVEHADIGALVHDDLDRKIADALARIKAIEEAFDGEY